MKIAVCLVALASALTLAEAGSNSTTEEPSEPTETPVPEIAWTPEGVQEYDSSNPYHINLGGELRFVCPMTSHIYVLTDIRQYEACNCTIPPDLACDDVQLSICPADRSIVITFAQNSLSLPDVFDYIPGRTYYFASFAPNQMAGGPCLPVDDQPGVRMAVTVFDNDEEVTTAISTTESSPITIPVTPEISLTNEGVKKYNSSNPFPVDFGGQIRFICPSNLFIYVLTDIQQYQECTCTIPPNLTCADTQLSICPAGRSIVITFAQNSISLPDVFDYSPGQTYYFAAYENVSMDTCFVRMAVRVLTEVTTTTQKPTGPNVEVSPPKEGLGAISPGAISGATVGAIVVLGTVIVLIVALIVGLRRRKRYELAKSGSVEERLSPEPSTPAAKDSKPKPGDPDYKEDLSTSLPIKASIKPFQPSTQLSRSLNNYEDVNYTIRGSTVIADPDKEKAISEEKNEEGGVEREGETQDRITESDNVKAEPPHLNEDRNTSQPMIARLASIDDTQSLSKDLISLNTPKDTGNYSTSRQFSWTSQKKESISSFTGLAVARANENTGGDGDTELSDDKDLSPVFEESKNPPASIPTSTMIPSFSVDDILHAVAVENTELTDTDLSRPKPKPKPRTAKKSESSTTAEEVKLDLLSTNSKRKSFLTRSTSVDGFSEVLGAEGKVEAAVKQVTTLSRPKPKPRARTARKSESSAKEEQVRLDPLPSSSNCRDS